MKISIITSLIRKFKTDLFFRRYIIYFSGSMVVAFLNYLFYPILGRLLNPTDFGDIQALISLINQSAVIFGAFSIVTVNLTANVENPQERDAIISELQKVALWVIGVVFLILLFSIFKIKSFFNFSSIYPLVGLAVILSISAITIFKSAYLQGSGQFINLSVSEIISSSGRLVFSTGFILLGLNVLGATFGIILANMLVLIYLIYITRDSFHLNIKVDRRVLRKGSIVKELKYGILVFFVTGLVAVFYTSDVLIVKHYLNPLDAGLYSGVSAIAKILFFAISPISAVLLASVKLKQSFEENSSILAKSFLIALVIGSIGILFFYKFDKQIVNLMVGSKYVSFANFLPIAGFLMFCSALTSVFVSYFLALRRFFLVLISLFGAFSVGFVLFFGHVTINAILMYLIVSLLVILILLTIVYAKDYIYHNTSL